MTDEEITKMLEDNKQLTERNTFLESENKELNEKYEKLLKDHEQIVNNGAPMPQGDIDPFTEILNKIDGR